MLFDHSVRGSIGSNRAANESQGRLDSPLGGFQAQMLSGPQIWATVSRRALTTTVCLKQSGNFGIKQKTSDLGFHPTTMLVAAEKVKYSWGRDKRHTKSEI